MTRIQQVLLEVESAYAGHPYFVTGHALFQALARRVDDDVANALAVSVGVFVPGEYGSFPEAHSQPGGVPYMGAGLRSVEAYEDLFLFRDAAQRWLLDSRPRDAHNTHDVRDYAGRLAFAPATRFGRPPSSRNSKRTVNWYVQFYVHASGDESVLPLDETVFDGLRVGGARNYGLGETSLEDTQVVDLEELNYSRVRDADAHVVELVSPFVLRGGAPGADAQLVPWWWACDRDDVRLRETRLARGSDVYAVEVVDHGQVVEYTGGDPVQTALNGVLRVGTHSKFGFGELRVRPADANRVTASADAGTAGDGASAGGEAR